MDVLDVFIIGGGPIGLTCGIEAQKAGLSYLIVEKGCLCNSLYNYPKNMTFFLDFRETGNRRCAFCIHQYETHPI